MLHSVNQEVYHQPLVGGVAETKKKCLENSMNGSQRDTTTNITAVDDVQEWAANVLPCLKDLHYYAESLSKIATPSPL